MNTINEINYEAYYLDYLEGNLDEVLTAELLVFLAQHPELEVDLEDISLVAEDVPGLNEQFKHDLKMVDFDHEAIHWNNVDAFLIAALEGDLSKEKQMELQSFVAKNPGLQSEQNYYKHTVLQADKNLVYSAKSNLKKKAPVFSMTRIVLIAASFIGFLFAMSLFFQGGDSPSPMAKTNKSPKQIHPEKVQEPNSSLPNTSDENQVPLEDQAGIEPFVAKLTKKNHLVTEQDKDNKNTQSVDTVSKSIKSNPAPGTINNKEVNPLYLNQDSGSPILAENSMPSGSDYAVVEFKSMNNPYSPITTRLSDLIHTDLDIRMAKPTQNQSGGFYLKIGKIEISRRKY